jgi:hypothetical protein
MRYLVLDDLSKAEAERYFVNLIVKVPVDQRALFKKDLDCFDKVFNLTGGRIIFLKQYVNEVCRRNEPISGSHFKNMCLPHIHFCPFDRL